eukprot:scaffold60270_cov41-Tisochrysis_lutea.AAC.2
MRSPPCHQTCGRQSPGPDGWEWCPADFKPEASAAICAVVAARYKDRKFADGSPVVVAFELLNEPELSPRNILLPYYKLAYKAVRDAGMSADRVQVGTASKGVHASIQTNIRLGQGNECHLLSRDLIVVGTEAQRHYISLWHT